MSAIGAIVRVLLEGGARRTKVLGHADRHRKRDHPDVAGRRDLQRIVDGAAAAAAVRPLRLHRLQFARDRIVGAATGARQHAARQIREHGDALRRDGEVTVDQRGEEAGVDLNSAERRAEINIEMDVYYRK